MGKLEVNLQKITDLKDEDHVGKSDPYVRFELEHDNLVFDKSYGEQKSSIKEEELNPIYDETFTFEDIPRLEKMELKVKVMDDDKLKDEKLGECKIKLDKLGLTNGVAFEGSWTVDNRMFHKDAEIYLAITWYE